MIAAGLCFFIHSHEMRRKAHKQHSIHEVPHPVIHLSTQCPTSIHPPHFVCVQDGEGDLEEDDYDSDTESILGVDIEDEDITLHAERMAFNVTVLSRVSE